MIESLWIDKYIVYFGNIVQDKLQVGDFTRLCHIAHLGRQPWSSIFQFRRTKSRIQFDNLFWFISLLSTTKKKFPKINLHDSELMTNVHIHG